MPFATTENSFGTAITHPTATTFNLNAPGNYAVRVFIYTATLSALGGVTINLNGTPVGGVVSLLTVGAPIVTETIVNVTVTIPSTITVTVTGLALTLATGTGGHIQIEKLN
ncbi:BclA C-terminal domain-containing protein [Heyndrickxia vini]|uniref:BclA C-terminal domain-containing protein n=1 Tax=Heyndrickxia vini TaxID=1476025 RepID=UPI003CCE2627